MADSGPWAVVDFGRQPSAFTATGHGAFDCASSRLASLTGATRSFGDRSGWGAVAVVGEAVGPLLWTRRTTRARYGNLSRFLEMKVVGTASSNMNCKPRAIFYAVALMAAATCSGASPIGGIEFFGYGGLDIQAIRSAIPELKGTPWTDDTRRDLREFVKASTGTDATDIAVVCCDEDGDHWVYVGLSGATSKAFRLLDEPKEDLRLPQNLLDISARLEDALIAAVAHGGDAIQEDRSRGFSLTNEPTTRSIQLEMREYALGHAPQIYAVLRSSSDAHHRAIAAEAAGYVDHSATQINELSRAIRDPDGTVRNNAVRALAVLAGSGITLAAPIEASLFIELLSSDRWADRNKSIAVLVSLTQSREARVLAEIKERSLDALVECARWRWIGHAYAARVVLGRISGLEEVTITDGATDPDFVDAVLSHIQTSITR